MQTRSYFGGRLVLNSLPRTDNPGNRTEVRARIISPKGELAVLSDGVTAIQHLTYLELRAGILRGNHFHKRRHEYFYLISGEVTLVAEDLSSGEAVSVLVAPGDMAYIEPRIAHALKPLSSGHALEYAAEPFDLGDVYPHVVKST